MRCYYLIALSFSIAAFNCNSPVLAQEPASAVGAMLNLLKSGRVPESRLGTIVKLVCGKGNEHDLAYVFEQLQKPDHWPLQLRQDAAGWLLEAAENRKVKPAGELSSLSEFLKAEDPKLRKTAIQLAGLWKSNEAIPLLKEIVLDQKSNSSQQHNAIQSITQINPAEAKNLLSELIALSQPFTVRSMAVGVLASIDLKQAAAVAIEILQSAKERDDPANLVDAFLNQQGGSAILAAAISEHPPGKDVAKLALRHMYSVGRSDPELSIVLAEIAGIAGDPKPLTIEQVLELADVIAKTAVASKGELVFRRNDLSCMKCHAVSKAGGQIGPDLSALGASSPMDYIITSVLDPDQAIKEAYTTKVVMTVQGLIHQGIVEDRTAGLLTLKDATGKKITIAADDIDDEIEGKSLMPKGLMKFMTDTEFNDLVKFLSMLGKPGDYAVRSTQRMQRWRLLKEPAESLLSEIPSLSTYEDLALRSPNWVPVYAKVNGDLPLSELTRETDHEVVYVKGELDVSAGGKLLGKISSAQGVHVWVNDQELGSQTEFAIDLPSGIHQVVLRVDTTVTDAEEIQLEFKRAPDSKAEFVVVDGQ